MSAPTKQQTYRVVLRHIPFRKENKNCQVQAASKAEAWAEFMKGLHAEHKALTPHQRKVIGRQQADWLAVRDQHPGEVAPRCDICTEEEYQQRLADVRAQENRAQLEMEVGRQAIRNLAEGSKVGNDQTAQLIAELKEQNRQLLELLKSQKGRRDG